MAGSSSAIVVQLAITALGMTSLMLLLSEWFEWLRWAGVAYLVYLGVQHWRASAETSQDQATQIPSPNRLYWRGFVVNATNPKTLFFYAAFFPQFVDPAGLLLCATFLIIATLLAGFPMVDIHVTLLDGSYALLGGRLRGLLGAPRWSRLRKRLTGSLLIGAGLGLALVRRS